MSEPSPDSNVEAVRALLLERSKVGLGKYGVTTSDAGLNQVRWLQHLLEELLDASVYVMAAIKSHGWRPIETAPKDGTEVALLFANETQIPTVNGWLKVPRVRSASWLGGAWSLPYYSDNPPIAWHPLPAEGEL